MYGGATSASQVGSVRLSHFLFAFISLSFSFKDLSLSLNNKDLSYVPYLRYLCVLARVEREREKKRRGREIEETDLDSLTLSQGDLVARAFAWAVHSPLHLPLHSPLHSY